MNLQRWKEDPKQLESSLVRLREPLMRQGKQMKDGLMNTDKIDSPLCHR